MKKIPALIFFLLVYFFLACFDIYVSNVNNAFTLDAYLLNYVDDIFHYCYAKASIVDPLAILNPYAKLFPTLIQWSVLKIFSPSILYLRFLNSFISLLTISLLYSYCKKLGFNRSNSFLVLFITLTFPLYFLSSASTLVEPLFCFLILLSIYLFSERKFILFSLVISLLPITHQIGIIYALGTSLFFLIRRKYYLVLIISIPISAWVVMNSLILKHALGYTFFYQKWISPYHRPPENSLLSIHLLNPVFIIATIPLLILFLIGYFHSLKIKKYLVMNLFALPVLVLIIGYNLFLCITEKSVWRELRYFIPIIPLLAVFIVNGIGFVSKGIKNLNFKYYITVFCAAVLFFCSFTRYLYLQKDVKVIADRVTPYQEDKIIEISEWLNVYMDKNKSGELYLLNGGDVTNKYVRRIWMRLNINNKFYCFTKDFNNNDKIELFDLITYKFSLPEKRSGIFLHTNRDLKDAFLPDDIKLEIIKEAPEISLFFFIAKN